MADRGSAETAQVFGARKADAQSLGAGPLLAGRRGKARDFPFVTTAEGKRTGELPTAIPATDPLGARILHQAGKPGEEEADAFHGSLPETGHHNQCHKQALRLRRIPKVLSRDGWSMASLKARLPGNCFPSATAPPHPACTASAALPSPDPSNKPTPSSRQPAGRGKGPCLRQPWLPFSAVGPLQLLERQNEDT